MTTPWRHVFLFEEQIIMQCSPTLAGIKAASLFPLSISSRDDLFDALRRLNRMLRIKGITFIPLKILSGSALIYVFRPALLARCLSYKDTRDILIERGYDPDDTNSCIRTLIRKLNGSEFPHEIGLFLGYPAEDVAGFIRNKGRNYLTCGMWKVYGNRDKCEKLFRIYRECTIRYLDEYLHGNTVERLTVAV